MENAKITTSVDVKLGHADMIEMLVEEQLENFENQIAAKIAEMSKLGKTERNLRKKIETSVLKDAKLDKRKDFKPLIDAAKLLGLTVDNKNSISWKPVEKAFDEENQVRFNQFEHLKSPMTKYREAKVADPTNWGSSSLIQTKEYHHAYIELINTSFCANDGVIKKDKYGGTFVKTTVELTKKGTIIYPAKQSAATKALYKKLEKVTVDASIVDKEIYALKCQLFELEHSGKRHKAKFLKAMLGNSEEGKSLLGLMKNVGGMNLLESGQE